MKRMVIAGGSIFAITILFFAFMSVNVSASTIPSFHKTLQSKLIDLKINSEKQNLGFSLFDFLGYLFNFIIQIIAWMLTPR